VSPGKDQVLVIHLTSGNDLAIALQSRKPSQDRVGEAVGVLCQQFRKYVNFSNRWMRFINSLILMKVLTLLKK
jgi:hypothetical protein